MVAVFYFAVRTRSVDVTISNILEGAVTYVPQVDSLHSVSPVNTVTQESKNIPSTSTSAHLAASTVQVIYCQVFYCLILHYCHFTCNMRCWTQKFVCTTAKSLTWTCWFGFRYLF